MRTMLSTGFQDVYEIVATALLIKRYRPRLLAYGLSFNHLRLRNKRLGFFLENDEELAEQLAFALNATTSTTQNKELRFRLLALSHVFQIAILLPSCVLVLGF